MTQRELKGKSLLGLIDDYVVIDIETTGLSYSCDIIEIAAIKVVNNEIVDSYSSLIKPIPYFEADDANMEAPLYVNDYITALTGITNEMLKDAPDIKNILPVFSAFIGNMAVVGHNIASFDSNFLYDAFLKHLKIPFSNDCIDTMRLFRLSFPSDAHHRLKDLAGKISFDTKNMHRALNDCVITQKGYEFLKSEILKQFGSAEAFNEYAQKHTTSKSGLHAKNITTENNIFDTTNPLHNSVCVFTGTLEKMGRKEAMQLVADVGGINADSVTKKTNYLILGNNDYCPLIKEGKSNKQKKAEKLKLDGCDIEIMPENVFYDLIGISTDVASVPTDPDLYIYQFITTLLENYIDCNNITVEHRTDSYVSIVYEQNDFLRYKYTDKAKWISIRMNKSDSAANKDNPLFSAQANKNQLHWKAKINSLDDLVMFKDFIIHSCIGHGNN